MSKTWYAGPALPQVSSPSRMTSSHGEVRDRLGDRRAVLRQPVAREQANVRALPEREQADAVELALEDPLRPGEPLLRQRRRHRLDPFGKGHDRDYDLPYTAPATPSTRKDARSEHCTTPNKCRITMRLWPLAFIFASTPS